MVKIQVDPLVQDLAEEWIGPEEWVGCRDWHTQRVKSLAAAIQQAIEEWAAGDRAAADARKEERT